MCPAGGWHLRQTASAGGDDLGFTYNPGTNPYPVVGDWDADGTDTVGVKAGLTWLLNDANDASGPEHTFTVGGANDLPVVSARNPLNPLRSCRWHLVSDVALGVTGWARGGSNYAESLFDRVQESL